MDRNDFFREATLKICGNLAVEEALHTLVEVLISVMPVSKIYLQHYDRDYQAMRTIAYADMNEGQRLDLLTPLSEEAAGRAANPPVDQDTFLFEDPYAFPVSREMTKFHELNDQKGRSVLVMTLRAKTEPIGFLVLVAEGETAFADEHRDWVSMLKEPLSIAMSNALRHREVTKLNDLLADDNRYLHHELHRLSGDEIVGAQFGLRSVMFKVQQVASLNSPVLLLGETGVGKDVIANYLHYASARSDGPFVSVNCGAIPDTLIDSELFGHEKGAFTGALSQKRGRFERADKGTIFLDEVGELPPQAQVRLLRVLQSREIERVGGVKTISLDIRIIAATNQNLEDMIRDGRFREDLWFRLNVFPIWIPPLRDRRSDIPALLQHFITVKSKELKLRTIPTVLPEHMPYIMSYPWPGNVRELQNVVERALILNPEGPLSFEHLRSDGIQPEHDMPPIQATDKLDDVVAAHIRSILEKSDGRINGPGGAAELLGVNPNTLRNRMKKLKIPFGRSPG